MKKISIIHPSRSRPKQCLETAEKWQLMADNDVEYIISLDNNDPLKSEYIISSQSILLTSNNRSAIDAINNAAKIATGDILIVVSDDTDCPEHWDTLLLDALKGKSDFVAKVDDGLQPTLVTMPVMDRVYYERYGYIYENGYEHLFCDQELTAVAIMTGKYIKIPLLFKHLHYSTGLTKRDAINIKNDLSWHQGETRFNERLKDNFGIENPIIQYKEIQWR